MPNHVMNVLELEGDLEEIRRLREAIMNDEEGEGSIDFQKIIPMPESLDIIRGSETSKGIEIYLTSLNPMVDYLGEKKMKCSEFKKLVKEINLENIFYKYNYHLSEEQIQKIRNDCEKYGGSFEKLFDLGKTAVQNFQQYGAFTWYEWRVNNWGSKWNAYDFWYESDSNILVFNTAWCNVSPIISKLSEMYPQINFRYQWADEDFGNNTGMKEFHEGKEVATNIPESYSKEAYELASEILGIDLKESYVFNEKTGTYEYIDEENEQQINL